MDKKLNEKKIWKVMKYNRIDWHVKSFERYKKNKELILKGQRKAPGNILRKLLRPLFRLCLCVQRKVNGFSIEMLNNIKVPQGRPVIFAITHIGKWDFEIVNEQIKEQFFVIAADFLLMHGTINGFFMNWNGVIYLDEKDKEDKVNTKKLMVNLLQSGNNIMIFPEGTWNLSENEIVRDIAYGAAEAAISAGAVIIPIAIEQYGKHFVICPGEILEPAILQQADKKMLTIALRDEFASLKWKIWERNGIYKRKSLPYNHWRKFIQDRCAEWKGYDMEGQIVNGYMPTDKWDYWQIQRDLKTDKIPLWYRILLEEKTYRVQKTNIHLQEILK